MTQIPGRITFMDDGGVRIGLVLDQRRRGMHMLKNVRQDEVTIDELRTHVIDELRTHVADVGQYDVKVSCRGGVIIFDITPKQTAPPD